MARTVGTYRRNRNKEAREAREERRRRRRRAERSVSPEPARLSIGGFGPFEDIAVGCRLICAATALQNEADNFKPCTWPYYLCVDGHVSADPAWRGHQIALIALQALEMPRDRRVSVVTMPPDTRLPLWNVPARLERDSGLLGGMVCRDLFALIDEPAAEA
jgi:hypothetical protein